MVLKSCNDKKKDDIGQKFKFKRGISPIFNQNSCENKINAVFSTMFLEILLFKRSGTDRRFGGILNKWAFQTYTYASCDTSLCRIDFNQTN